MKKIIRNKPSVIELKTKRFKYEFNLYRVKLYNLFRKIRFGFRWLYKTLPILFWSFLNLRQWKNKFAWWLLNTFAEGLIINYVLFVLFGCVFNIFTIFAFGLIVWELLDILKRIKN